MGQEEGESVSTTDAAELLRLVADIADLPDDPLRRRQHFMEGMGAMVGVACSMFARTSGGGRWGQRLDEVVFSGFDTRHTRLLSQYVGQELEIDPCAFPMSEGVDALVVSERQRMVEDKTWYGCGHYLQTRQPLGLDDALYGRVTANAGRMYGFVFVRERSKVRFSPRDHAILRLGLVQAARLLRLDRAPLPMNDLPPRVRPVAERLLAGDSAKEAARYLGLSVHTVIQYTKVLHKRLGVSSRAELLLELMRRRDSPR